MNNSNSVYNPYLNFQKPVFTRANNDEKNIYQGQTKNQQTSQDNDLIFKQYMLLYKIIITMSIILVENHNIHQDMMQIKTVLIIVYKNLKKCRHLLISLLIMVEKL